VKNIKVPSLNSEDSAKALFKLLSYAVSNPKLFINDDYLIKSLKSQGGIANLEGEWEYESEKVCKCSMSINTLKKYSNRLFGVGVVCGWDRIDELRKQAKDEIEKIIIHQKNTPKNTKVFLKRSIDDLNETLEKHKKINFILLQAISSAMSAVKNISNTENIELRQKRAKVELDRISGIISLNPPPFNEVGSKSNVISIISEK